MWLKELGNLYSEGWNPGSPNLPGDARGVSRAQETHDSLRYKGVFGSADSPANMASLSMASGQNPYEQEEEVDKYKNNFIEDAIEHIQKIKYFNDMYPEPSNNDRGWKTVEDATNHWKDLNDKYGYLSDEEFQKMVDYALDDSN